MRNLHETANSSHKSMPVMIFGNEVLTDLETAVIMFVLDKELNQPVKQGNLSEDEKAIEGRKNIHKIVLLNLMVTKLYISTDQQLEFMQGFNIEDDKIAHQVEQATLLIKQKGELDTSEDYKFKRQVEDLISKLKNDRSAKGA